MGIWRRRIRRLAGAAAAVSVLALLSGWLLFQHIPSWYRPPLVPAEEVEAVWADWVKTLDALNEKMSQARGPFEWSFTESQINRWLAIREVKWPLAREWLPENLSDPQVLINADGLRLAAISRHGSLRFVISADLRIAVENDYIAVELKRTCGGSLPLPSLVMRHRLAMLERDFGKDVPRRRSNDQDEQTNRRPRLSQLPDGIRLPAQYVWWNPKRSFRILGVRYHPGRISVTLAPAD